MVSFSREHSDRVNVPSPLECSHRTWPLWQYHQAAEVSCTGALYQHSCPRCRLPAAPPGWCGTPEHHSPPEETTSFFAAPGKRHGHCRKPTRLLLRSPAAAQNKHNHIKWNEIYNFYFQNILLIIITLKYVQKYYLNILINMNMINVYISPSHIKFKVLFTSFMTLHWHSFTYLPSVFTMVWRKHRYCTWRPWVSMQCTKWCTTRSLISLHRWKLFLKM